MIRACHRKFTGLMALMSLLLCMLPATAPADETPDVLKGWMRFTDAENAHYHHLAARMLSALEERSAAVARIEGRAGWEVRREEVRSLLGRLLGPFPERTPLKARITGTATHNGIRLERIIFESQPGFHVTGGLFMREDLSAPAPGLLYLSGHANEGFRSRTYMHIIQNLALKGFVVFAIDPVGQGERVQYWDEEAGKSWIGGPTLEHSYPGAQCFLSGFSLARTMTWDAVRAIDYLVSREQVDPARIGVTGRSGGGTQTAYVSALDSRVLASAPENYLTSFRRLIESRGLQDAEQNLRAGIANGIDMADLVVARAPSPTLVIATTRDIFNIQGTRELVAEVRPAFTAFGHPQHLILVEDDAGHSSTRANREAMYAFFQTHLDLPGDSTDLETRAWPAEALRVTETGQLATSLDGETVFSLNLEDTRPLLARLEKARDDPGTHLPAVLRAARRLSGWQEPLEGPQAVLNGHWPRGDYTLKTGFIEGEGNYAVPFLLFVPDEARTAAGGFPAAIYLHPEGKAADAGPGGPIETLMRQGRIVLAPDLLGLGETGPGRYRGDAYFFRTGAVSYNLWFAGVQLGRSLTGIRAGDIARTAAWLRQLDSVDPENIGLVAIGDTTAAGLHAAAFDPGLSPVVLTGPLTSWTALVSHKRYRTLHIPHAVPAALEAYDLPDLAATLAPRPLTLINPVDHAGEPARRDLIEADYALTRTVYARAGAEEALHIKNVPPETIADAAAAALKPAQP